MWCGKIALRYRSLISVKKLWRKHKKMYRFFSPNFSAEFTHDLLESVPENFEEKCATLFFRLKFLNDTTWQRLHIYTMFALIACQSGFALSSVMFE